MLFASEPQHPPRRRPGRRLAPLVTLALAGALLGLGGCAGTPPVEDHAAPAALARTRVDTREVMFIHGMFVTPRCWDGWRPLFEQAGYTVSAPPWPEHEGAVATAREPAREAALGRLRLAQVLDHYRALLKDKPVKPILVGHSMGGLVAQILLQEGLAQAAVVIDSAPPRGILFVSGPFLKSNWALVDPFADADAPVELSESDFAYAFANEQTPPLVHAAYLSQVMPESRHVGRDALGDAGAVDTTRARGPLLLIAGADDHIIPAALVYKEFERYRETPARTDFLQLPGRDHWLIAGAGWDEVAGRSLAWIRALAAP